MFRTQTTKSYNDRFLALNQQQLSMLLTFIDFAEIFQYWFSRNQFSHRFR
jgi:hypothetical protein